MKTIAKRILSLITVVCLAFIGVFTAPTRSAKAAEATYEETTFGVGQLLITTTYNNTTYYLPTTTTTSSAPMATSFTSVDDLSLIHI